MAEKMKFVTFLTDAFPVTWANVLKPSTKFKPDGEYQVSLKGTPDQMKALQKLMTDAAKDAREVIAKEKGKPAILKYALHVPIKPETNKDTGDETGDMILKTTLPAVKVVKERDGSITKVARTVPIIDSKTRPIRKEVGRGSLVRVSGYLLPFANDATKSAGVSARITMVQVLKLVEVGGAANPEALGFKVEDGYEGVDGDEDSVHAGATELPSVPAAAVAGEVDPDPDF